MREQQDAAAKPRDTLKYAAIVGMIMGKAFPFGFVNLMVPTVYSELGLPLEMFWVFSLANIPYWFKWLWAPIVDRYTNGRLGRRKTWILASALFGAITYAGIGLVAPDLDRLWWIVGLFVLSQLSVAIGEIAIYAYCSENLDDGDRTFGTTLIVAADNVAYLAATSGLVLLYEFAGWGVSMFAAAGLLLVALAPVLIRAERRSEGVLGKASFAHFFRAPHALGKLLTQFVPGIHKGLLMVWYSAFLVDKGVPLTEIAVATGVAFCAGGILSAVLTPLIIGGRQPMSAALALSIGFVGAYGFVAAIALGGRPEFLFLVVAMCVVEIMMAAFNATLYASAFKWASAEQTATDISLQDSSFFLGMTIGGAASGGLAAWLGWLGFYFAVGAFAVVAIWSYAYWAIRIDGRLQSETAN